MNEPFDGNELNPAEKEFESALSGLPAAQTSLDPQAIWAMSVSRRQSHSLWFWRATSVALAASLIIVFWARRPTNAPRPPQIVYIHDQQIDSTAQRVPPTAVAAWSEPTGQGDLTTGESDNYLRMRHRVMQKGLNSLMLPQVPLVHSTGALPASDKAIHGRGARATAFAPPEADAPADIDRAIEPSGGPVQQFFDLLNKGSQL